MATDNNFYDFNYPADYKYDNYVHHHDNHHINNVNNMASNNNDNDNYNVNDPATYYDHNFNYRGPNYDYNRYLPTFAINDHHDYNYDDHDDDTAAHDDYFVNFDYIVHDDGCTHYVTAPHDCPHSSCKTNSSAAPTKRRTRRRKRNI